MISFFRKKKESGPYISNYLRTAKEYHSINNTGMINIGQDETGILIANCTNCGAHGVILQDHKCWRN